MGESDRDVLHIIDHREGVASHIEQKVPQDQVGIKNGTITEANSVIVDLAAFNGKAQISVVL